MSLDSSQLSLELAELSLLDDEPVAATRPARPAKKGGGGFKPITLDPKQQQVAEAAGAICDLKGMGAAEVATEAPTVSFPPGQRPSLRVNAVAGSGKSRTLLGTIGEMGRWDGLLLSTFNSSATLELKSKSTELYPALFGASTITGAAAHTINALGDRLIKAHFNTIKYTRKKEPGPGEVPYPKVPLGQSVDMDAIYFDDKGSKYPTIIRGLVDKTPELQAVLPTKKEGGDVDLTPLSNLFKLSIANLLKHPTAEQLRELIDEQGLRFVRGTVHDEDEESDWLEVVTRAITHIQKKGIRMLTTPYEYQTQQNKQKAGFHVYTGVFSFEDQVWAPFYLDLKTSVKFSRALIDEYQDLSIAQFDVLLRWLAPDAPVILYGDTRQTIYGFNGAGPRVTRWLDKHLPGEVVELNDCYRCPDAVLAIARHFNPKIRRAALAGPDAPGSRIAVLTIDEFLKEAGPGDVVLSRTRASAVRSAMRYAVSKGLGEDGKFEGCKVIIRKDFGLKGRLNRITESVKHGWLARTGETRFPFMKEFQPALNHYAEQATQQRNLKAEIAEKWGHPECFRAAEEAQATWEEVAMVMAFYEYAHDKECGQTLKKFQDFMANTIVHLADDAKAEQTGGIEFRTVHAMKGAEADRVFVVDLGTTYSWTTPAQKEELANIRYVCLTRARRELFLVTGFVASMDAAAALVEHPVPRPEDE